MNYVIIGNSAAAVGCIEGIRQIDKDGRITVISKEKYHTYSRPLISYLLAGKTNEEKMKYRPDSFYEDMNCKTILGAKVIKIDAEVKQVVLDNRQQIIYDKLLIATGSSPFLPPMNNVESVENKFTFMSIEDVQGLGKAVNPKSKVLIIGAGLIGLKCAQGLHHKVDSITVVDLAPRILPSILDEQSSQMVKEHIENQRIKFILGESVNEFSAGNAILTSGAEVNFDVLVIAVGVRPNVSLLAEAGGKVNKGIVTDCRCKTTLEDIYSAGDCSESYDITANQERVLALLPNAYMQGECAGINMAGGRKLYEKAMPMNAIDFFGLHMITAGSYQGEYYINSGNNTYKKLFYKDGMLKGYILVGDVARAGIYTSMIREKTPLDTVNFELIKEKPQLMAFSKKDRAQKLGGAKK